MNLIRINGRLTEKAQKAFLKRDMAVCGSIDTETGKCQLMRLKDEAWFTLVYGVDVTFAVIGLYEGEASLSVPVKGSRTHRKPRSVKRSEVKVYFQE